MRDHLDKVADDASFNGVNLLRGDNLKITFNEIGTSDLEIQAKDGKSINSGTQGLATNMEASDFGSDADIDNQEAANLLALPPRQQLSLTALSMASQADQSMLHLF